jgi:phytoene synthase
MLFQWFPKRIAVPGRDSFLANPKPRGLGPRAVMDLAQDDHLPPEAELAIAWSAPKVRAALTTALQLDRRIARIVARTTEPMLGQMRLAWWREALGKPVAQRPRGDVVLDAIGAHWEGRESALVAMVDGWEVLVTATALGPEEIASFAAGRGAFFGALQDDPAAAGSGRVALAGQRWALADAAAGVSDPAERAALVAAGLGLAEQGGRMPSGLRGLAVLEALALRALRAGGQPLMAGRGASLTALRAAIFLS